MIGGGLPHITVHIIMAMDTIHTALITDGDGDVIVLIGADIGTDIIMVIMMVITPVIMQVIITTIMTTTAPIFMDTVIVSEVPMELHQPTIQEAKDLTITEEAVMDRLRVLPLIL